MSWAAIFLVAAISNGSNSYQRLHDRTQGRERAAQRGRGGGNAFFEFAPASGAGLQSTSPDLCQLLTAGEKAAGEYWCINGDTPAGDSSVSMVRTAAPVVTRPTKQCTGGRNCYDMTGLRSAVTQGSGGGAFFRSDTVSRATTTASAFTACAWVSSTVHDGYFIGLREDSDSGASRYDLAVRTNRTFYARMSTGVCGGSITDLGTTSFDVDGQTALACVRYDGATGTLWTDTAAPSGPAIGAQCAGGAASRYLYGGITTVTTDGTYLTRRGQLYAGFHVSAFLDDSRLSSIAASMRANAIRSSTGLAISNARSTPMFCESLDGQQGTWLKAGESCISGGKLYKSRESTNSLGVSSWLGPGSNWNLTSVTLTDDVDIAPDGTLDADLLTFANGTNSYISRTYANWTCPVGASVLSFYVKNQDGTAGAIRGAAGSGAAYNCAECTWSAGGYARCQMSLANTSSDEIRIGYDNATPGCGAHAAYTNKPVLVWGLQCEQDLGGGHATPYIATRWGPQTRTADKPTFTVPSTPTAPLALRGKWKSPPVAIALGDVAGVTNFPPYLVALGSGSNVRNFLRFLWYTAEYQDGSSSPLTLALELTNVWGDLQLRGQTTSDFYSTASLESDVIGPYLGAGTAQTFDTVNIGWSGANLNFDGLIGEVCIDTKADGCQ